MAGAFDPTQLIATGGVGGFLVAMGWLFIRGSRSQSETFKETIKELRLDKKTLREERDSESARADNAEAMFRQKSNEKHEVLNALTKERIRVEFWAESLQYDVVNFLRAHGIDADFKLKELPEPVALSFQSRSEFF